MAFGGTAVVQAIGNNLVRISGVTLCGSTGDQSGTISWAGGSGDVKLPAGFPRAVGSSDPSSVSYLDIVEVRANRVGSDIYAIGLALEVTKTMINGNFLITVNAFEPTGGENPSLVTVEIYVQYHVTR